MIVANMATYPPRRDSMLEAVRSLAAQVDVLNLVLNEYPEAPAELRAFPNVNPILPEHDTKDTGKYLPQASAEDIVFTVDDDIGFPPDYVVRTLEQYHSLGAGPVMAGYHGTLYRPARFLRSDFLRRLIGYRPDYIVNSRRFIPFGDALREATVVDELGTGVSVMRGCDMPPFEFVRDAQRFIDVRVALWCHGKGIPRVCLARNAGWLRPVRHPEGIWQDFTLASPPHVAREIRQYAFKASGRGRRYDRPREVATALPGR